MRCFGGLQLIFLLSLTQCITVSSLPQGQGFSRPTPSGDSLASELLSAASAFQSSTAANGNGGGNSNTQATATGSSVGTGTGTGASTATRTSNASAGQSAATGTATGTAAADRTGTTGTAGTASVTGTASNLQGTAGTASGATATTNSSGATGASNSASPANTGGASSNDDPDSTSGGGNSNGDGSGDDGDGGSGSGSGSGSGADTQNRGSSNSGLSRGELAAVVILPIFATFAIFFFVFRYYRQIRERFSNWRANRNERGAYRRALDDPVGVFAIKHRRHSTGLSLPDMQSIMRPLSFGFSHPQRQTIKRKPLNYDASRINDGGFSSIGMAVPSSTADRNVEAGGGDAEAGHQRTESEVSALTHATANANGAPIVGGGRPRTHSSSSSFSSVSSNSSEEESTGFVDARSSQRASQITS